MTATIAFGLFGVLAWGLLHAQTALPPDRASQLDLDGAAEGALRTLSAGAGTPPDWATADSKVDALQRLGLAEGSRTVRLSQEKIARMHGAGIATASNGKLDYDEAKAALGLGGFDFHLRTYPVFDPYAGGYFGVEGVDSLRLGYIGDYTSGGVLEGASSVAEGATLDPFPLHYTNTRFAASQAAPGGDKFPDDKDFLETHLLLRLAGWLRTEHAVTQDVPGATTWRLLDNATLQAASIPGCCGARAVGMGTPESLAYGALENDRLVSPRVDVRGMAQPRLTLREYVDGDCTMLLGSCVTLRDYSVVEVSANGLPLTWTAITSSDPVWTSNGKWRVRTFDLSGCAPCAAGPVHLGFRWVSDATTHKKGWALDEVKVHDAVTKKVAWSNANEFDARHYDILVVGSNVDQNALNSAAIKWRLRDWVLAGGQLYVFGSTAQSDNWMQPIFGAGLAAGAATTPHTPDPSHPLLMTPNALSYASYPHDGKYWRITQQAQGKFAQVVGKPAVPAGDRDDTLGVTVPGAYGNGTVILTTYLPYQMTGTEDEKLIANFLMYGRYAVLYLDYGKPIPPGKEVGAATRLLLAPKTVDGGGAVELRVVLQAWRG